MPSQFYSGTELEIFAHAKRWKRYFRGHLAPYLSGDVLEVGAGIGGSTRVLSELQHCSWTCVEADSCLAEALARDTADLAPRIVVGTIDALPEEVAYDTILYIDVLEHIKEDGAEVERALLRLRRSGYLVVVAPAHQRLYSRFDAAVGHFRRYNMRMLKALTPPAARLVRIFYLDSVGMFASLANRLLLRQSVPTLGQILTWDRWMIPVSRFVDPALFHRIGKTIVAVWQP